MSDIATSPTSRMFRVAGNVSCMAIDVKRIDVRRFAAEKMQKLNLFETPRFFCDVYCLEPGQEQRPHAHAASDKVYIVLEGEVAVQVGDEQRALGVHDAVLAPAGQDHGVRNAGAVRAALLVMMTPPP